jgi:hypothetical protein
MKKLITDDTRLWFECGFGKKSSMNLAGKIACSPVVVFIGVLWIVLDFLFLKQADPITESKE